VQRKVEVRRRRRIYSEEFRRRDADHRKGHVIDENRLSNRIRRSPKAILACRKTDYGDRRRAWTVVALGLTTDMCVSTTVRVGANLGYRMIVAGDACAAFDQPGLDGVVVSAATIHAVHPGTLANEFAEVATVEAIIAALAPRRWRAWRGGPNFC